MKLSSQVLASAMLLERQATCRKEIAAIYSFNLYLLNDLYETGTVNPWNL